MKRRWSALVFALALASTSPASAEVTYREFHGDVYGSDGTRIHRFGGDTYIRQPNGREVKCHKFADKTTPTSPFRVWMLRGRPTAMKLRLKGVATVHKKLANGRRETYRYAWRGGPRLSEP